MTIRDELHGLVDRLADDQAKKALEALRHLLHEEIGADGNAATGGAERMTASVVSGRVFLSQPSWDVETLAAQQGVRPVADFNTLLGDFWPEDETADEFIAAVRRWRREGGGG